ncbi:hypothetical protein PUNSTDRAFT_47620 [Punctularia strigosozonata HHB-11173 SS5]|uniref:Uncharacterized protein n=1 Tax=Punctularia strigosozonata (strain HHB-11173) TaxID=741275 RepID=R7S519_PUNST|nr:uncharacterized protein PUNSTDRAFT_47620 [Punctularia strigosozonata HHB-11173 SS5]EIN04391.1 hypothetical protein PUNSTDRAFT_47620 [Punctularia strigosozonata HHB-11173 SS5]
MTDHTSEHCLDRPTHTRPLSLDLQIVQQPAQRRHIEDPVPENLFLSHVASEVGLPPSIPTSSLAPNNPPLIRPNIDKVTRSQLKDFFIFVDVHAPFASRPDTMALHGVNALVVARAMMEIMVWDIEGQPEGFAPTDATAVPPATTPKLTKYTLSNRSDFFSQFSADYHVGEGFGRGPQLEVFLAGVEDFTSPDHGLFGIREQWRMPLFGAVSTIPAPKRERRWNTFGTFLAVHIIQLRHRPPYISPLLVLACLHGVGGFDFIDIHPHYLEYFHPGDWPRLKEWFDLGEDLSSFRLALANPRSYVGQLLLEFDMQGSQFSDDVEDEDATRAIWRNLGRSILTHVLFQCVDLWNHPSFVSFKAGFNFPFSTDVDPKQGLLDDEYFKHKHDGLLRSRLFLTSMLGTPNIPTDPNWKIKINMSSGLIRSQEQAGEMFIRRDDSPPLICWHACSLEIDVSVNSWLLNALLQDAFQDPSTITDFDIWMHSQVWSGAGAALGTVTSFSQA